MCEKRSKIFRRKFHRSKKNRCPRIRYSRKGREAFTYERKLRELSRRIRCQDCWTVYDSSFFLLFSWTIVHSCAASTRRHKPRETRNKSATEGGCISFPSFLSIKISAVVERKVVEIELLSIEQRRWSIFSKIKVECRVETRWAMIIRREYKNERGQRRRRINIYI